MKFCCTSSSSILWRTMRALCGGPPLASISGNCRCFNASVFELQPMHLGTFVTRKFTRIWESLSLTTSDCWRIRLKLSWCGKPLVMQLSRYLHWLNFDTGPPNAGRSRLTNCPVYPQKAAMLTQWIMPNWHFSTTLRFVPSFFPQL